MKATRRRRTGPGFSLLANFLEKDVRTIRRWIAERPELRPILRARRQGKQWRIDYPQTEAELYSWIEEVRNAVSAFTRTPDRIATGKFVKDLMEFLGFAGEELDVKRRERDTEILRHAMLLKRATPRRCVETSEGETVESNLPDTTLGKWEEETNDCCTTARSIAGRFKCPVEEAPKHWAEFCREHWENNRRFNAPSENWLKAHGLYERAMQLLPKGAGDLIAFIGAPRAGGQPRIKLYRFATHRKSNRNGHWRPMRFRTKRIQLLVVATDEEIAAEVSRMKELWPEPGHWQRARHQHEQDWQLTTLGKAALECVGAGKPVNGSSLAALLFRNQRTQVVWKSHQQHLELKRQGIGVFCDVETFCKGANRGISLREFRQRYTRKEIAEATKKAEAARSAAIVGVRNKEAIYGTEPAEDREHEPGENDETGVGGRDEHGGAMTGPLEKGKVFVSPETELRVRREIEREDFTDLTPEQRKQIEAALGRSLDDYKKQPFKEDFKLA